MELQESASTQQCPILPESYLAEMKALFLSTAIATNRDFTSVLNAEIPLRDRTWFSPKYSNSITKITGDQTPPPEADVDFDLEVEP